QLPGELSLQSLEGIQSLTLDALQFGGASEPDAVHLLIDLPPVHVRDDVAGEVQHLLQRPGADVQNQRERAGHALQIPDMAHRRGQLDVAHPLAADLRAGDLDAAAVTDNALELDLLVAAAVALPVLDRTEDPLAEEAIALRLEG